MSGIIIQNVCYLTLHSTLNGSNKYSIKADCNEKWRRWKMEKWRLETPGGEMNKAVWTNFRKIYSCLIRFRFDVIYM